MDWLVALYGGQGFYVVLNWMKLLASVDVLALGHDTNNCLVASISVYDSFKGSIKLGKDEGREESCSKFVKGLPLCKSPSEGNILC